MTTTAIRTARCEIGFVGGGFRATTFLASAWPVLGGRVEVFEAGGRLGPGAFADYAVTSTSVGSRFLKDLRYEGPFAPLREDPRVAAVATADKPVALPAVAAALEDVGRVLVSCGVQLHRHRRVASVHLDDDRAGVTLRTADGEEVHCEQVVLATGREERPHPDLGPWRPAVWLSSRVISAAARPALMRRLLELAERPVVIAGCSHSAMSALRVVLQVTAELRQRRPGYRPPLVWVLRRGPTRLMYDSVDQAHAGQVSGREQLFRPDSDVCPQTGIVFRDSGLRHESRSLYCAVWAGQVPGVRLAQATGLSDAAALLSEAGMVIQALGYRGRLPDILVNGVLARPAASTVPLYGDEDGAVVLAGRRRAALSVLRAEPTPRDQRDNAAYGSHLYPRLAARLTGQPQLAGASC